MIAEFHFFIQFRTAFSANIVLVILVLLIHGLEHIVDFLTKCLSRTKSETCTHKIRGNSFVFRRAFKHIESTFLLIGISNNIHICFFRQRFTNALYRRIIIRKRKIIDAKVNNIDSIFTRKSLQRLLYMLGYLIKMRI